MEGQVLSFRFEKSDGQRLDHYLVETLPQYSRARLQTLVQDGFVKVDGKPAAKSGLKLERGAVIEVRIPPVAPSRLAGEDIPLDIVFENENVVVINKAAGMVVHPAAGHQTGTLVNAVLGYDPDMEGIGGEDRPGVVHRLDKETSGLILLAKNDRAHRWLQDQFRLREVSKTYIALVDGKPRTPTGRVEAPIGRDPSHRKQMSIVARDKGREAVSEYKTLESFPAHTLLEFHPLTGRTHQIRVHCAFLGCPIVGDRVYGFKQPSVPIARHFLHAAKLRIRLPDEAEPRDFAAPLPDELQAVLHSLRDMGYGAVRGH
ncbi:MAG TPA: RluA family pseudouridine synthase [Anaerolineales bacterium]|nr:RluA family pseudouridine synthase [Anaerolineales bacterium]